MHKKRILIFDDNAAVLDALQYVFLENGYEVAVSQTLDNVIERADYFQPDLILMDYLAPDISGVEAISRLKGRQRFSDVPVILVSASSNIIMLKNRSGANDYLRKPFNLWDLETMVNKYLC